MPESARFPSTAWTDCVRIVQQPDHPDFVLQINHLIAAYWRPVFHYLRAKGFQVQDAEDLAQEFFCADLPAKVRGADRGVGRFRAYLKTLVRRFALDRTYRKPQWRLHAGFVSVNSLVGGEDRAWEPGGEDAEAAFDRQWKAEVLAAVHKNLEALVRGNPDAERRYAIFTAYVLCGPGAQPSQEELGERFGVSREAVLYALDSMRKRYEGLLRQEIRAQVGSEAEFEDEMRDFLG